MKSSLPILAGLLAVAAPLGAQNIKIDIDPNKSAQSQPAQAAKPAAAPAAAAAGQKDPVPQYIVPADGKYTDEQKMQVYGYLLARRMNMRDEIAPMLKTQEELAAFMDGMATAIAGGDLPYDPKLIGPQSQELLTARSTEFKAKLDKARGEINEKNQKEAKEFLATLDAKPGIKKTSSGLRYEIIQDGKGAKAKPEQAVRGYVKSTFITGEVLTEPKDKDGKPMAVELPIGPAVPGLKEGLQLVGVGGKIKLYIPAELAYADQGPFPGALTIFEVEVLEIKEPTKQPEEKK